MGDNPNRINLDQFEALYKPKQNHMEPDASYNGWLYETYGSELKFVKSHKANYIWTIMDVDGAQVITPGFHLVNRMGYVVTEIPWTTEQLEVIDDDDVERYYSYLRIRRTASGEYIDTGYNTYGVPELVNVMEEAGLIEEDTVSEYGLRDLLYEAGYTLEYGAEPFQQVPTISFTNKCL